MSSPSIKKLCASAAAIGGLALAVGAIVSSSCAQPEMFCTSAHGDFAVQFDLDDGDEDSQCGGLQGDVMGLETFASKLPDDNADFAKAKVAIKSGLLGGFWVTGVEQGVVEYPDQQQELISKGKFRSGRPDGKGFCQASSLNDAEVHVDEIPADEDTNTSETATEGDADLFPGQEETDITAAWSNFRIYVTPDAQGTQFSAKLDLDWNDCSATYNVRGLYPAIPCAEDSECGDKSGINPSFAVECDTDFGWCAMKKAPPSYE